MELNEILADISAYIEWELEEGALTAEISPEVLADLAAPAPEGRAKTRPTAAYSAVAAPPLVSAALKEEEVVPKSVKKVIQSSVLADIAKEIAACTNCSLHADRTNTVPGQGSLHPTFMFIGEAPGRDEDLQGIPFVGRAGQLLTKMIEAMGLSREDVFIANINKCRPPDNRKPTREEMDLCLPFLKRQIAALKPKVIIAMGATAVEGLVAIPEGETISKIRGQWMEFEGIPLMPTYHPAYLLRNPAMKRPVWEDLKTVLRFAGLPVPEPKKDE